MSGNEHGGVLRCAFIGDESLVAQCATIAAGAGLEVAVVASTNPQVLEFASSSGFATIDRRLRGDLAAELREHEFDALFSIAYRRIIPDDVLAQASTCINFHDGPLPGYAGLNVTTWAIHNGEAAHGITWHLMTREVDRGEVVLAETFPIEADDTAFSLNARCYEAGLASFGQIAAALAGRSLVTTAQPGGPRRLYKRTERPLIWIDPAVAARDVERGVRALDVGARVRNDVGSPRLLLGDEVLIPGLVRALPAEAPGAPGTVIAVDDTIRLRTADGDLVIGDLRTPAGRSRPVAEVAAAHGLSAGSVVSGPPAALVAALAELDPSLAAREPAWMGRLEAITPSEPALLSEIAANGWTEVVAEQAISAGPDDVVAAVAVWLQALTGSHDVGLAVTDRAARATLERLAPLATAPLVGLGVDAGATFAELATLASGRVATALAAGPFLRDLTGRDPALAGVSVDATVAVDLDAEPGADVPADGIVRVLAGADGSLRLRHRLDAELGGRLLDQLVSIVTAGAAEPDRPVSQMPLIGAADAAVLDALNDTGIDHDRSATIDALFRATVARTPGAPAISSAGRTLTYAQLAAEVDRLSGALAAAGVRPRDIVGIALPRGIDMVASVLAVLSRGAAYLPLDPTYPEDRLRFMISDSGARVVVAEPGAVGHLTEPGSDLTVVTPAASGAGDQAAPGEHAPADLAYVIYTSGSTGLPKGVELEHRNVVNFFVAMDAVLDPEPPGVWLAVTSLSFDISVLELLWTLTRGFHVVVKRDSGFRAAGAQPGPRRPTTMSLFYFAAASSQASDGYRLLLDSAEWADRNGFEAVWTPERHFHEFGAPYPNPSVVSAALAARTEHISIRAGSVVLPLHSPVRVAEEWAVVDNLSRGRVAISFAAGWQPNDFVLNPSGFANARDALPTQIDVVRRLWRGEEVELPGHDGTPVPVRTLPRPAQPELPVWITSAGSPSTFERAGTMGTSLLTHLLGQSIEQLEENIARYRSAWKAAGHAGDGHVTVMVHTYVDTDAARARETARLPLKGYLGTAVGLLKNFASAFPIFANAGADADEAFRSLSDDEMSQLLDMATERYLSTSGVFGTADDAVDMIERLSAAGADEVACLIDFGIDTDKVLGSLSLLGEVHERVRAARADGAAVADDAVETVASLVAEHGVTHLQCTPSLASMLYADPDDQEALRSVRHLMLGGEALPVALAADLRKVLPGRFTNMYGPTETTIWSLTYEITDPPTSSVPIGAAIGNNTVFVLDAHGRRLPVGVFGELHIGGEGVARGYHDRPELTASRFVDRPGMGRVYATGDLVRVRPDGVIEFGGRLDSQVKIRGHRIELGEIEAVLDAHPGVAQSVVVARGEPEPSLFAFVIVDDAALVTPEALREHVAAVLPDAMVPSAVVPLDEFPLTPNGKVDRKRLPADVDQLRTHAAAPPVDAAPAEGFEGVVAAAWAAELGRSVGRNDNFFEIGGHSLLAVKVFRRLTEATGARLSLTDVFRYPTVRTFAEHLESLQGSEASADGDTGTAREPSRPAGTSRGDLRRRALGRRTGSPDTGST